MRRKGQPVLLPSPLGLKLVGADFSRDLKLVNTLPVKAISDRYLMAVGKRSAIQYRAVCSLVDAAGHKMDVTFRVPDDGVVFRYAVRIPVKRFVSETTGFAFNPQSQGARLPLLRWSPPSPVRAQAPTEIAHSRTEHEKVVVKNYIFDLLSYGYCL